MKRKDRLAIILSIILLALFAIEISGNIKNDIAIRKKTQNGLARPVTEILAGLEKAGLEPREAKYYEVIK